MQYLYKDGDGYTFMDNESYEQIGVEAAALGDATKYLKEGDTVILPDLPGAGRRRRAARRRSSSR